MCRCGQAVDNRCLLVTCAREENRRMLLYSIYPVCVQDDINSYKTLKGILWVVDNLLAIIAIGAKEGIYAIKKPPNRLG